MITCTSAMFDFLFLLCCTVVFLCNLSLKLSITDKESTLLGHFSNTSLVIQQAKKLLGSLFSGLELQYLAYSGHHHASGIGAISLCSSSILLTFTLLVCLFLGYGGG